MSNQLVKALWDVTVEGTVYQVGLATLVNDGTGQSSNRLMVTWRGKTLVYLPLTRVQETALSNGGIPIFNLIAAVVAQVWEEA